MSFLGAERLLRSVTVGHVCASWPPRPGTLLRDAAPTGPRGRETGAGPAQRRPRASPRPRAAADGGNISRPAGVPITLRLVVGGLDRSRQCFLGEKVWEESYLAVYQSLDILHVGRRGGGGKGRGGQEGTGAGVGGEGGSGVFCVSKCKDVLQVAFLGGRRPRPRRRGRGGVREGPVSAGLWEPVCAPRRDARGELAALRRRL